MNRLFAAALVLLALWAAALVASITLGGLVHLMLLAALALVGIQLVRGRRVM